VDSSELAREGFSSWRPFSLASERELLAAAPEAFGVYAVRCLDRHKTRLGQSDLVYIGSAANQRGLKGRIRQYFHYGPTQRTNQRIIRLVGQSTRYEIAFTVSTSPSEVKLLEALLLQRYEAAHGQLPPQNLRR
jgi:hypothetical protein